MKHKITIYINESTGFIKEYQKSIKNELKHLR